MNDTLDYIEAYFEKTLSAEESRLFEQRCAEDESFAEEVAFYITAREALREQLLEQKKRLWAEAGEERIDRQEPAMAPVRTMGFRKWLPYAAAASLLAAVLLLIFLNNAGSPQQLADNYTKQNLVRLSQTMDGAADSLQSGISAYNRGEYNAALRLFEGVYKAHPENAEAVQFAGQSYLMKKEYDKALPLFDELAGKNLRSNPGLFLKAVTLLERNKAGDEAEAKGLLERVRDEKLEHSNKAAEWLATW